MADSKTDKLENGIEDVAEELSASQDDVSNEIQSEEISDGVEDIVDETDHDLHADDHHQAAYEEHEDDRHPSLSSRLLTWLAVLIAGAGLALWGGPKVAPQLPEWAAPVAKFLTPGGDAAVREVTALRSEVDGKLGALETGPDMAAIEELVQKQLGAAQEANSAEFAALKEQLGAIDGKGVDARLSKLESRIEGIGAELTSLNGSVQEAITSGGNLSEQTIAQITSKSAEVEGMRAEVAEISGQIGGLNQRLDDVETAAKRRVELAQAEAAAAALTAEQIAANTALQTALDTTIAAAAEGNSFTPELDGLIALGTVEVPETLISAAASGIPSLAALTSKFDTLSHDSIRASIKEDAQQADGAMSKLGGFLKSQVAGRSLTVMEGDSTDAVLSRIGAALRTDNLGAITDEAAKLAPAAKAPLEGWLADVEQRHSVLNALKALSAQPS